LFSESIIIALKKKSRRHYGKFQLIENGGDPWFLSKDPVKTMDGP